MPHQLKRKNHSNLTIKPDGSVEPSTYLLERNGTTYTFKGDIFGTITVQTGGITIDGAGHTLQGVGVDVNERGLNLVGPDASHADCRGVLVENMRICNYNTGIYSVGSSNNTFIGNYLENAGIHLIGSANYIGDLYSSIIFSEKRISLLIIIDMGLTL